MTGRTHQRLVQLIESTGFSGVSIHAQKGHWRSSPYADVVRWEGFAIRDGHRVEIYSWDTMTACVKCGVEVSNRNSGSVGHGYEFSAVRHE